MGFRRLALRAAPLLVLLVGCAAEEVEGEWRSICDGSDELRLAFRNGGGGGGCAGSCLQFEIGWSYLYVRGDCRYWVDDRSEDSWTGEARTGVLTDDEEESLSRVLHYDSWPEIARERGGLMTGSYHFLSDGEVTIDFTPGDTRDPPDLSEAGEAVSRWTEQLRAQGDPLDASAPVRVDVFKAQDVEPPTDESCELLWPFAIDPDPLAWTQSELARSRLVADPEVARAMRAFRGEVTVSLSWSPAAR